jgi:hypothetical protein
MLMTPSPGRKPGSVPDCASTTKNGSIRATPIARRGRSTRRPVDMWTIGFADWLRLRFPSKHAKPGNACLRHISTGATARKGLDLDQINGRSIAQLSR